MPLLGETVSHDEPEDADQLRVPPPLFVMVTACGAGALPPRVYEKAALVVERDSEGAAALTVSVTEIIAGLFVAPEAETVTIPACGPVDKPAGLTVTVRPLDKDATVIHDTLEDADQLRCAAAGIGHGNILGCRGSPAHRVGELKLCAAERNRRRHWRRRGHKIDGVRSGRRLHDDLGDTVERRRKGRDDRRITPRGNLQVPPAPDMPRPGTRNIAARSRHR